jgi:hypothetical protein
MARILEINLLEICLLISSRNLLNRKKYTKTKEEDALLNLKIKKTKVMQQTILQLGIESMIGL